MKKITLLAATALTIAGIGSQPLIAQAAPKVYFAYGSGCNMENILEQLENCFPIVNLPGINNPDNNGTEDTTPDQTPEETPDEDTSGDIHAYVKEVIGLVNAERAKEGLSALTMNLQVQAAAQVRAMECEQRFSHTRPNGTSFATALKEQNVSYRRAGENIAWGQRDPQTVVNAWMNSEGHRANIMNPNFTTIGVGYYQNANGTNYWCQLFTN